MVAQLISAEGNKVVLQTPQQKKVTIAVTGLVDADQLYLVQPLLGYKGDFLDLSLFVGETEIPGTKNLELDDEFTMAGSRFRAERVRLPDRSLALKIHSLRTKKVYGPIRPEPGAEIVVGGMRLVFRR